MVQQAVEDGRRDYRVAEELLPVVELLLDVMVVELLS
jgi:hypothetical protein